MTRPEDIVERIRLDVPSEREAVPCRDCADRQIRLAVGRRADLEVIDAARGDCRDDSVSVGGRRDADARALGWFHHFSHGRRVLTRGVGRGLEVRPGDQQPGADPGGCVDLAAPPQQLLVIPSEVADRGDAMGDQQRQRRCPRLRDVGVHVDQAGDQEAPAAVDDVRIWDGRKGGGRADVVNAIIAHEDRTTARRLVIHR